MGKRIQFQANGKEVVGYLAEPTQPGPGVIVLQEWWGLVPQIESVADRFAAEGFVALAPDLYGGKSTVEPDEAGTLMQALNIAETERTLAGAIRHLLSLPLTQGEKVGTVGFCMGGQLSLLAATTNPQVGACVNFYGVHPAVKPNFANLHGPVLGLFGGKDHVTPPSAVEALRAKLEAAGKPFELHTYPEAAHAFFNDGRPEVYDADAAADAWSRVLAFFRANLGG